jgi:FMN phosphatase YigB (HAD superfamily)
MKLIFDLDDTLYKNEELREAREKAIHKYLKDKLPEFLELKKEYGTINSFKKMGIRREIFFEIMESVPIILKEDKELMNILKKLKESYKIFVLSNISSLCVKKTLESLGILHLIDEYYGGDNFVTNKPSKETFSMVEKGDICIGNNFKKDLEIPKEKGAIAILISQNSCSKADYTIKNIYELPNLIERFKNASG